MNGTVHGDSQQVIAYDVSIQLNTYVHVYVTGAYIVAAVSL